MYILSISVALVTFWPIRTVSWLGETSCKAGNKLLKNLSSLSHWSPSRPERKETKAFHTSHFAFAQLLLPSRLQGRGDCARLNWTSASWNTVRLHLGDCVVFPSLYLSPSRPCIFPNPRLPVFTIPFSFSPSTSRPLSPQRLQPSIDSISDCISCRSFLLRAYARLAASSRILKTCPRVFYTSSSRDEYLLPFSYSHQSPRALLNMSFGGFGGFGQSNNQQSSGFGGFGSNTSNNTSGRLSSFFCRKPSPSLSDCTHTTGLLPSIRLE